jgi:hypothetical protein
MSVVLRAVFVSVNCGAMRSFLGVRWNFLRWPYQRNPIEIQGIAATRTVPMNKAMM